MKKALLTLVILGALGGGGYAYYNYRKTPPAPTVMTAVVTRGNIADTVGATGTLQAVTTVQVGTQVSGIVQDLYADFNTLVRKGQVIARLDPSTIQTQIEQARANLIRAQADLERLRVTAEDARTKLKRAQELSARNLIPAMDLETAQVNVRSAEAQIKSAEASIVQSQASLRQNEVNLEHTVITAPIDGLVISRNVDRGQTVAASMQAPTLFVLAADLTKMQVVANLDESDVGRIRPGQHVTFHVDAYPAEDFTGTVTQVRLQPIMQQNVVTYATVIEVPNPQLKLKPGMTANVNIEIARRDDVIRVPNAALRFRPTNEIFAALGQTPPETPQRDLGGRGRGDAVPPPAGNPSTSNRAAPAPEKTRPAATTGATAANRVSADQRSDASPARSAQRPAQSNPPGGASEGAPAAAGEQVDRGGRGGFAGDGAGGFGRGRGGSGGGRAQNLSPEEREQLLQRMRARGFDPTAPGAARGEPRSPGGTARGGQPSAASDQQTARGGRQTPRQPASAPERAASATTIDALFGPLPTVETRGRVWLHVDKQLKPVQLRLGISDGQATELLEGDLQPGTEVVTNVTIGSEARPVQQGGFPFVGQPGRGGFPGGGNRGGGNNGGGGRGR
jgi:HlyD family secretion protein